jgi:hypothetical protein
MFQLFYLRPGKLSLTIILLLLYYLFRCHLKHKTCVNSPNQSQHNRSRCFTKRPPRSLRWRLYSPRHISVWSMFTSWSSFTSLPAWPRFLGEVSRCCYPPTQPGITIDIVSHASTGIVFLRRVKMSHCHVQTRWLRNLKIAETHYATRPTHAAALRLNHIFLILIPFSYGKYVNMYSWCNPRDRI